MAIDEGLLQARDGDRQEPIAGAVELEALGEGPQARGERRRNCVEKLGCDCYKELLRQVGLCVRGGGGSIYVISAHHTVGPESA